MPQYVKGLTKIELALLNASFVPGTYFEVGDTERGSFSLTTAEGTKVDIFVEEKTKPIITETQEGPMTAVWNSYNWDAVNLAALFGGTVTAATGGAGRIWKAPRKILDKLYAMRITTGRGHIFRAPQVSVFPTMDATVTADAAARIHFVGTIQDPEDGTTEPFSLEDPIAA